MATLTREGSQGAARNAGARWQQRSAGAWWSQHREASLNWLALGLLLAAWNASDDDPLMRPQPRPRPESLRGYPYVSVRAATLHSATLHPGEIRP